MSNRLGRAGIIGGGIAGLAAAIALHARGWDVTVYERSKRFTEVGAGIFLSVNALRALDALGVGAEVRAHAIVDRPCTVRNDRGRVLLEARIDDFVGGLVVMHRAELIAILAAAVPEGCIRWDSRVLGVDAAGNVETATETTGYDLVVGADGVHSQVRKVLWPEVGPVRRTGIVSWRWIFDAPITEGIGFVWGRHAECGVVPGAGGRTVMYAAARPAVATLDHFADWPEPVPSLIAAADPARTVRGELLETAVARRLDIGRVVLVGDAAHAMLPTLGQGACQALEDAVVLADVAPDWRRYSAARRRRVAALGFAARQAMRMTGPGSPVVAAMRDAALSAAPDAMVRRALHFANRRVIGNWHPPATFAIAGVGAGLCEGAR